MPDEIQEDVTATPAAPMADGRDSLIAEIEALGAADTGEPADEATDAEAAEETSDKSLEAAEEPEAEPEPEPAPDEEMAARLAEVQKAERAGKEAVAKERAAFEAERKAFEASRVEHAKALEEFTALKAQAAYEPAAVLRALGITDDQLEQAARAIYAASPKGQENPANRAQSQAAARLKKIEDEARTAREEAETLRKQIAEREELQQLEAQIEKYIDTVVGAETSDTPIVTAMIAKSPAKARAALRRVGDALFDATGEMPDPVDVKRKLEENERAELESRGIDVSTIFKKSAPTTSGEKTKRPATLEPLGSTTQPRSEPESREELLRDLERQIAQGNFEV